MKKLNKNQQSDITWSSKGVLTKRNDVRIGRIRQLQHRQLREQQRLFLCEGARFLIKAMDGGVHVQECVYAPQLFPTAFSERLVRRLERRGVPTLKVTPEVFLSLTLADEPAGLLAVCRQKTLKLVRIEPVGVPVWLVLDAVRSPGNLGTIMRTCQAVGVAGLILLGEETDPYHPAAVRASMGALMALNIVRAGVDEFFDWAKRRGVQVVGTSPAAAVDYRSVDYTAPTAVLMGSERKGMQGDLGERCDLVVRIPMVGETDSLNLAVATGVMLYEVVGQRGRPLTL